MLEDAEEIVSLLANMFGLVATATVLVGGAVYYVKRAYDPGLVVADIVVIILFISLIGLLLFTFTMMLYSS